MNSSGNETIKGVSYNYEALLDEHFQHLIQSLLVKDYPDLQCFPVGMPDGGRDAVAGENSGRGMLVFQVKFSRNPSKLEDPLNWIIKAIDGELHKIERLTQRNANRYIL